MADFSMVNGQVVGGQSGEGVLIELLEVKFDSHAKTKKEMAFIEISGTAHTLLKDPYNVSLGASDLPEALPVTQRIEIPLDDEGEQKDFELTFQSLSKAFDLEEPLEDRPNEWERFMSDSENSVYDKIVGKNAYFRGKLASGKTGEKSSDFYWNIVGQAKRVEANLSEVKKRVQLIKKRKEEERKRKEEEYESTSSALSAGGDDPIPF